MTTKSTRRFAVAGYVNTSHGRVETTVLQTLSFSNQQQFTSSATQYLQDITQGTDRLAVDTARAARVTHSDRHFSYPLTLDYNFVANPDGSFAQTTTSDQKFDSQDARVGTACPSFASLVSNDVKLDGHAALRRRRERHRLPEPQQLAGPTPR